MVAFNTPAPLNLGPESREEGHLIRNDGPVRGMPAGARAARLPRSVLCFSMAFLALCGAWTSAGDWDSPNWETDLVDSFGGLSGNTGLSAAVDSQGRTHVAYYALDGAALKYALRAGPTWSTETVDDFQVVGPDCSIALDAEDRPHICYYDDTNEELEYAYRNGTGWHTETVDMLGIVGVGTTIAIGPAGDPYMAYIGARTLRCAHREGEDWNVTVVDDGEKHIYTPSMTVDGHGVPHIVYFGAGVVKHAFLEDGVWKREDVDVLRGSTVAMRTSLREDANGELVACYANDMGSSVIIARRSGDEWEKEKISESHFIGDLDMELDAEGEPHVALYDLAFDSDQELVNTDVWYMEREGGSWTRGVVVSSDGHQGVLLDLQLDGEDDPCLALMDLDPVRTEADLTYLSGWSGGFIEAYTGEPNGGDGYQAGDGATDGSDNGYPLLLVGLIVVVVVAAVALAYYFQFRNAEVP